MSSPNTSLNISVIQMCSSDSLEDNFALIFKLLNGVGAATDLVCLPENCTYIKIGDEFLPEGYLKLTSPLLIKLNSYIQSKTFALHMGGVPILTSNGKFNASVWLEPGKEPQIVYKKIHLFDVDVAEAPIRESDNYNAGDSARVVEYKGWKIGLSICYDVRFPELYLEYYRQNVDLLLVPAAFLPKTGAAHWHTLLKARAIEGQCYVVAAAQAGEHMSQLVDATRKSYGHSIVVNPWGSVVVDSMDVVNTIENVSLDRVEIEKIRAQIPMSIHRKFNKK